MTANENVDPVLAAAIAAQSLKSVPEPSTVRGPAMNYMGFQIQSHGEQYEVTKDGVFLGNFQSAVEAIAHCDKFLDPTVPQLPVYKGPQLQWPHNLPPTILSTGVRGTCIRTVYVAQTRAADEDFAFDNLMEALQHARSDAAIDHIEVVNLYFIDRW